MNTNTINSDTINSDTINSDTTTFDDMQDLYTTPTLCAPVIINNATLNIYIINVSIFDRNLLNIKLKEKSNNYNYMLVEGNLLNEYLNKTFINNTSEIVNNIYSSIPFEIKNIMQSYKDIINITYPYIFITKDTYDILIIKS